MENVVPSSSRIFSDLVTQQTNNTLADRECPTTCVICRNSASGYHYNVPSCNGCKTFFRRTILAGRKFVCSRDGSCFDGLEPIDTTKRTCRACRFSKCVEFRMNPMSIQADVQTIEGKELRSELVAKMENSISIKKFPKLVFIEESIEKIISKLTFIESKIEFLHSSGIPPGFLDTRKLDDILNSTPIFNVQDIPNMIYVPPWAHEDDRSVSDPPRVNYMHSSILAILEFSKTFQFSDEINFEDKKRLLKHTTVMCSNILAAFFSINRMKSDQLLHPDGTIAGPTPRRNGDLFNNHRATIQKTLISLLKNNINSIEYLLLKAIAMCNSAVSGLSHETQKILEKERRIFLNCLLGYCFQQYGALNGPSRLSTLLATFSVFENQQKHQKDFHTYIRIIHQQNQVAPPNNTFSTICHEIFEG